VGAAFLLALGFGIRASVIGRIPPGTSERTTRRIGAASLNTTGLYSITRNPLYLGNLFLWISVAVLSGYPETLVMGVGWFWSCYDRVIRAEERFLGDKFGADYLEWASGTPRFLPARSGWVPSRWPWSTAAVVKREVITLAPLVAVLMLVEAVRWVEPVGGPRFSPAWLGLHGVAGLLLAWGLLSGTRQG
jgi:hypothetical protein